MIKEETKTNALSLKVSKPLSSSDILIMTKIMGGVEIPYLYYY